MNPDRGHGRMRTMLAGHTTGLECEDISCDVISEKRKKRERGIRMCLLRRKTSSENLNEIALAIIRRLVRVLL